MVHRTSPKVVLPELSYAVTGILFVAHNRLGRFAKESQYAGLIAQLFTHSGIPFEREVATPFVAEGGILGGNRLDFLIDQKLVLELKAKPRLERQDFAQVRRYLDATGVSLGMLVNFRDRFLTPRRLLRSVPVHSSIRDHS